MLRTYLQLYRQGILNPTPQWRIVREFPGTATIDGDRGLGMIQGPRAMRLAMEKAKQVGVGIVTIFNSGHLGAVGHHSMVAARGDMVGMCMTATGAQAAPTFASEPRFGTNPISLAAPARHEAPVYFDVATSAIAGNKVRLAARVGAPLLPGWVADKEGNPIMEETPASERGQFWHLPLGGTREQGSHKGYGFALMAEIMGSMLAARLPLRWNHKPVLAINTSSRPITSRPSSIWIGSKTRWTACSIRLKPPNQSLDTSAFSTQVYPSTKMSKSAALTASHCTGR